tara:strand:- start:41 stop:535 length:495 start_codon:yes stop_codon:yes gene_type:complete
MLRKTLLFSLFLFVSQLQAQTEADFEKFGAGIFSLISDTGSYPHLEYIRIKSWKQLIDEQDLESAEKEEWKLRIQDSYANEKIEFEKKLGLLVQEYRDASLKGAEFTFLESGYAPHPKWKNWYQCYLRFGFEHEGVQTMVDLNYELYYNGKGLLFIGTRIDEDF